MSRTSLLWSLQPPEGKQSYLFGTMHVRDHRAHQLCDHLYPYIEQSDAYVAEMDLHDLHTLPPGPVYHMKAYFTAAVYQKLRQQLIKSFSLDIDQYAHLHPLLIMSALTQQVLQNDHTISLDEHLWTYARDHDKEMSGLETVHEQMELLHAIEPDHLYRQIRQIGGRPGQIRKFTQRTLEYYMQGNIHGLYRLTKASMQHLRKKVIFQRNELMCQRLMSLDLQRCYFVAVGAGHLSGKYGLISLLRKEGWRVKPVIYS